MAGFAVANLDMTLDPHGQPYNIRFNRARRAERDLSEFLGLAKGLLGDGVISETEATLVANWVTTHPAAAEQWPINHLVRRLTTIFSDGIVDDEERVELADILASIVGGTAGVILGEDASTELPLDVPPPEFRWPAATLFLPASLPLVHALIVNAALLHAAQRLLLVLRRTRTIW